MITYLNTDLILKSKENLRELALELKASGFLVLGVSQDEAGLWHASFETDEVFTNPEDNIHAMLGILDKLDSHLSKVWYSCEEREFNIGFDCGLEPWAFNEGLSLELLMDLVKHGGSLRITIYPERE